MAEKELAAEELRYPHPGCFGERGSKLLKTNARGRTEKTKRLQDYGSKGVSFVRRT